jgi:16S rRNA (uracil1498-N3)-methyltransferase
LRVIRIHVAAELVAGASVGLGARAAAHLLRVLRMKSGDALNVFDGRGAEHAATLGIVRGEHVEVRVGPPLPTTPESPLAITLAQGVSRGERMDYAVQKATELGVRRIVPLVCERSVVRLDADQARARLEHWQGVAIAACEQCGRATLPAIELPRRLIDHLAASRPGAADPVLRVVLVPDASEGLRQLPAELTAVELLIGPEGGLSDDETRLAIGRGYRGLRLGPRVLRTETAAAAAIAVLQALRGDLG